jgi:hypothetical protein
MGTWFDLCRAVPQQASQRQLLQEQDHSQSRSHPIEARQVAHRQSAEVVAFAAELVAPPEGAIARTSYQYLVPAATVVSM